MTDLFDCIEVRRNDRGPGQYGLSLWVDGAFLAVLSDHEADLLDRLIAAARQANSDSDTQPSPFEVKRVPQLDGKWRVWWTGEAGSPHASWTTTKTLADEFARRLSMPLPQRQQRTVTVELPEDVALRWQTDSAQIGDVGALTDAIRKALDGGK